MADAWGGSWGSTWGVSWTRVTSTPTATPVGGGRGGRRRAIIDDVIYEGTEEQLEALLWDLLDQQRVEPAKTKPARKRKNPKAVELKEELDYVAPPLYIDIPRFERFVAETYRHEDAFMRGLLARMLKQWQDEEDDIEALLFVA